MHILCSITFLFRKSCHLCDNVEKYFTAAQPQMKIWSMRIACWVHKTTDTHSEYVIIIASPLQQ